MASNPSIHTKMENLRKIPGMGVHLGGCNLQVSQQPYFKLSEIKFKIYSSEHKLVKRNVTFIEVIAYPLIIVYREDPLIKKRTHFYESIFHFGHNVKNRDGTYESVIHPITLIHITQIQAWGPLRPPGTGQR